MPSDEDVFKLREEERVKKLEERSRVTQLSVQEKSTFTSRMGGTMADALAEVSGGTGPGGGGSAGGGGGGDGGPPVDHRRRDKENMTDFIAKKREIFLVQMSLDTKRAEIRKLEERALQREEVGLTRNLERTGARLVIHHKVYRCSPGRPPHSVLVLATSSTPQ